MSSTLQAAQARTQRGFIQPKSEVKSKNQLGFIAGGTDKDAHFAVVHYAGTVNE